MTELELKRALAELSAVRSDAEPVVTLYLDTHWSDEKQRERARVFVQEAVKRAIDRHVAIPQIEALRRTLDRASAAATERILQPGNREPRGQVVFACEAIGLWRVLDAPRAFKNELCVDARPHLLQLARLADDAEPAIVAFVNGHGAQLYQVALGAIVDEATIEVAFPRHHDTGRARGGASPSPRGSSGGAYYEREQKNQRHMQDQVERARREVADVLVRLWEREPRAHVVLVGTSEAVADLERQLPERVRGRVLARLPRPPGKASWRENGTQQQLVSDVVERIAQHERGREAKDVEHAVGEALRGGLAVLGPDDVVLAVNERRVQRLILEEDFERSGWRCRNCAALGMTHDEVCCFCQGPLARVDSLGEELMGRVLAEDGEVEIVAHTNRLHSYAGVAALLRQARANGLTGVSPPAR
jgi:peptide subunit release factor 1 (eRF1)